MKQPHADDTLALVIFLLEEIFGDIEPRNFAVRLWDGSVWGSAAGASTAFTLVLQHPGALRRMLLKPTEENLARCFIRGDFDIEGDFEAVVPMSRALLAIPRSIWDKANLALRLLRLPDTATGHDDARAPDIGGASHSTSRDQQAVTHHYDVSNDFYKLWLDDRMVYSCACFTEQDNDLDRAQLRKLDMLCRKLRLQPGQRLLDIGCGWGGLLRHAVEQYGVEGVGITLSAPQADEANARFAAAGIADRCRAEILDYRDLADEGFDAIVSVGMVEHVGGEHLDEYFAAAYRLLRPEGVFLLHGIGDLAGRPERKVRGFVRTYVFPDSDLPPITTVLGAAEVHDFEVRDVESLRENYTGTLRHWARRLEARRDEAVAEVGEETYRIWRLYLSGCAWWFERGYISVFQSLFVKRSATGTAGLPLNRFDWYEATPRLNSMLRDRRPSVAS
ncbi:MAG TPA: cyclopropane-fatty-acyl-phospholipid synthase family protein [Candidatus Latescibacteria bacterium]|nr:cyclopropane-fatty-acyl-phospholipid synthase family protein [Candidatus Latescibacterota bacterium]